MPTVPMSQITLASRRAPDAGKISWTGRASEVWMRRADLPKQSPKKFEKKATVTSV